MTTTSTTRFDSPSDAGRPTTPAPRGTSRAGTIAYTVVAVLAAAGIAAGLVIGLGSSPSASPVPSDPAAGMSAPIAHSTPMHALVPSGGSSNAPAHHVTPQPPAPPAPSVATETLQRELGRLNYYEGPITGTMTPQTVQAIDYLQRDANLPQTGVMNAQTQAALAGFLAHGNNQMGS